MESETEISEPSDTSDTSDVSELSDISDTLDAELSSEFEEIHTQMTSLIALQEHLLQRMSRLSSGGRTELHDVIDRCHRDSLQDVSEKGRVTLGERILRYLEG